MRGGIGTKNRVARLPVRRVGLLIGLVVVSLVAPPFGATATGPNFLDERFGSWSSLDSGWTIWNGTKERIDTYFDIQESALVASNNLRPSVQAGDYTDATANWSSSISYSGGLVLSYNVHLPDAFGLSYSIGYTGSVFRITLYDAAGSAAISTRFGSPDWSGFQTYINPPGFAYYDGTVWRQIGTVTGGWHSVSIVLEKGRTTWTVSYDGVVTMNLPYPLPVSDAPDLSKIEFANGLKEEVQRVLVDNVQVFEGTDPGVWNTPPATHFSVDPSVGGGLTVFGVNASSSKDRQDPTPALRFRWDWEDDGMYDTSLDAVPRASHTYPAPGVYRIRLEVTDSGGLTGEYARPVVVADYLTPFLMESFSSWPATKENWQITNGSYYEACGHPYCSPKQGIWNYFDVRDGGLFVGSYYATGFGGGLPETRTNATMNWTGGAAYTGILETHAQLYLPPDPMFRVPIQGSGEASLMVSWSDASGTVQVSLRIVFTSTYRWAISDGRAGTELLSTTPGWHQLAFRMAKDRGSTDLILDGDVHSGPALAGAGFDVSKIQFVNEFWWGSAGIIIDNVAVGEAHPLEDTAPPVADAGSDLISFAGAWVVLDGRGSYDRSGIQSYEWTFVDTEPRTLFGPRPGYPFPMEGIYGVTLTVTDNAGNTATDLVRVTVLPADQVITKTFASEKPGLTWEFTPSVDGRWVLALVNRGFRAATIEIVDASGGISQSVLHKAVRFRALDAYPVGIVEIFLDVQAGHAYRVTLTDVRGPVGAQLVISQTFEASQ